MSAKKPGGDIRIASAKKGSPQADKKVAISLFIVDLVILVAAVGLFATMPSCTTGRSEVDNGYGDADGDISDMAEMDVQFGGYQPPAFNQFQPPSSYGGGFGGSSYSSSGYGGSSSYGASSPSSYGPSSYGSSSSYSPSSSFGSSSYGSSSSYSPSSSYGSSSYGSSSSPSSSFGSSSYGSSSSYSPSSSYGSSSSYSPSSSYGSSSYGSSSSYSPSFSYGSSSSYSPSSTFGSSSYGSYSPSSSYGSSSYGSSSSYSPSSSFGSSSYGSPGAYSPSSSYGSSGFGSSSSYSPSSSYGSSSSYSPPSSFGSSSYGSTSSFGSYSPSSSSYGSYSPPSSSFGSYSPPSSSFSSFSSSSSYGSYTPTSSFGSSSYGNSWPSTSSAWGSSPSSSSSWPSTSDSWSSGTGSSWPSSSGAWPSTSDPWGSSSSSSWSGAGPSGAWGSTPSLGSFGGGSSMAGSPGNWGTDTTLVPEDSYSNKNFQCGVPRVKPNLRGGRIVGGSVAVPHSWPWTVQLIKDQDPSMFAEVSICGGTLVSPRHVISALHCMDHTQDFKEWLRVYYVYVGRHDEVVLGQKIGVVKIRPHPYGDGMANIGYDMILMTLKEEAQISDKVIPACFPPVNTVPPIGKRCWASGWGMTYDSGGEGKLKQVDLEIGSEAECIRDFEAMQFPTNKLQKEFVVCAGKIAGKDTCQGDSGGPLVCEEGGKWNLYGATSWGDSECARGKLAAYVAVSYSMRWLCCFMKQLPECQSVACEPSNFIRV